MTDDPATLDNIAKKIDYLINTDEMHVFDAKEVEVLHRMIAAWRAADGFIRVSKQIGIVLAFVVIAWTQWDRLVELIWGAKS